MRGLRGNCWIIAEARHRVRSGSSDNAHFAAGLRPQFPQDIADRIGHAETVTVAVRTSGEIKRDWLGVARVEHERAGVAAVSEMRSSNADLIGEDFRCVRLRLRTVLVVVHLYGERNRVDAGARKACRAAALDDVHAKVLRGERFPAAGD